MQQDLQQLLVRITQLEDKINELHWVIDNAEPKHDPVSDALANLGLKGTKTAKLVALLLEGKEINNQTILGIIPLEADVSLQRVYSHRIRRFLIKHGLELQHRYPTRYWLTREDREKLNRLVQHQIENVL